MKRPSPGDVSNDVGCVKDTFSVQAAGSGSHQLESAEAAVSRRPRRRLQSATRAVSRARAASLAVPVWGRRAPNKHFFAFIRRAPYDWSVFTRTARPLAPTRETPRHDRK